MDNETEIRRKINYVTDLTQKSDRVIKGESKADYFEFYRNYQEVIEYLNIRHRLRFYAPTFSRH
jgi:hypothetical protein